MRTRRTTNNGLSGLHVRITTEVDDRLAQAALDRRTSKALIVEEALRKYLRIGKPAEKGVIAK